jgi:hypothetical protein
VEQFGAKIWAPAVAELEKINRAVRAVGIDILWSRRVVGVVGLREDGARSEAHRYCEIIRRNGE